MNHKKILTGLLLLGAVGLSNCTKYLDLDPLDKGTEEIYFNKPEDFKAGANEFYNQVIAFKNVDNSEIYDFMDRGSDISGGLSDVGKGINTKPEDDKYWNNPYKYIRRTNVLLQKAAEYKGDPASIAQYVAAAKFFRAWQYFFLLQRYGGVPLITKVTGVESNQIPELYKKRNSRYEVVNQILTDLTDAIAGLPKETTIPNADKGQVSKEAAKSFKSRVLLYEGTWEKYVGKKTDGDGVSIGAGSTGYDAANSAKYLAEAKQLSGEVIAEAEAGTFELWKRTGDSSYYFLFVLEDAGSNPAGADKSTNKEYIFKTKYDYALKQAGKNLSHTWPVSLSAEFGESFLCENGLPIILPDGSSNPQFQGWAKFTDEFKNRDKRFLSIVPLPGKKYWGYGLQVDGGGAVYGSPFPASIKPVTPALRTSTDGGGYGSRKFRTQHKFREANQESYDYPQIRLAEVYLIYAEATCELGSGAISDADLNKSINKTRARAGVAPLSNSLIAPYPGLTMMGEIRRERACELFGEGFRFDDLKRWGIAEQKLNGSIAGDRLGIHVIGTEYQTAFGLDNKKAYDPAQFPLRYGLNAQGRVIVERATDYQFSLKNYLFPIPNGQIKLNGGLLQNPQW